MIADEQMKEFTGFTVYDASTGDPVEAVELADYKSRNGWFAFTESGNLVAFRFDSWWDLEGETVPKEGKYIIQFGDGKYMRW